MNSVFPVTLCPRILLDDSEMPASFSHPGYPRRTIHLYVPNMVDSDCCHIIFQPIHHHVHVVGTTTKIAKQRAAQLLFIGKNAVFITTVTVAFIYDAFHRQKCSNN